jgi:hypothetical protein
MSVFLNKAQGLLKNKNELFSVLHAPIYKVTSSSILKFFENLKNCQLYYAHLQIEYNEFPTHTRNFNHQH